MTLASSSVLFRMDLASLTMILRHMSPVASSSLMALLPVMSLYSFESLMPCRSMCDLILLLREPRCCFSLKIVRHISRLIIQSLVGMVHSAIRIYRRDLYRLYGELSMAAQSSDMSLEETLMRQHDSLMKQLQEDYERFERYESDDVTAIGISLTDELLKGIDTFIDREGPVKNL